MPPDEPRAVSAGADAAGSLYDRDYVAWADDQERRLRQAVAVGAAPELDWEHLIEEVEDLGNRHRDALESSLARIIEHLLKLEHSPASAPRAGWECTVLEHRPRVAKLLARNPASMSLRAGRPARPRMAAGRDGLASAGIGGVTRCVARASP